MLQPSSSPLLFFSIPARHSGESVSGQWSVREYSIGNIKSVSSIPRWEKNYKWGKSYMSYIMGWGWTLLLVDIITLVHCHSRCFLILLSYQNKCSPCFEHWNRIRKQCMDEYYPFYMKPWLKIPFKRSLCCYSDP